MFEIDWTKFVAWLWVPIIRNAFWVNWCRALIAPIESNYNQFMIYRQDNLYRLSHTSQICSIEGTLNDVFDPIENRIFLKDAGGEEVTVINRDSDEPPYLILQDDATGALVIHNDSAYEGGAYDFIVVTPYLFAQADIYRLKALVDYYKLAGKRYDIIAA